MSTQNFEQLMNMYGNIKFGCGIAAIIFLLIAIALFFLLKIPSVFSELTGRGAKKAIEEMMAENESGGLSSSRKIGDDGRRHKKKNVGTSRLRKNTGRMTGSLNTGRMTGNLNTGTMPESMDQNPVDSGQFEPAPRAFQPETQPVVQPVQEVGETSVLDSGTSETSVLDTGLNETTVMRSEFVILRSIVEIHTDEVIG